MDDDLTFQRGGEKTLSENGCVPVADLVSFANGSLQDVRSQQVEAHLQSCDECRLRLRQLSSHTVSSHPGDAPVSRDVAVPTVDWNPNGTAQHYAVRANDESVDQFVSVIATFGRFRNLIAIGAGGFGIVYRAEDPLLGREVAVKIPRVATMMSAELKRRFQLEARAVATLHHPGIVPVHEIGEVDGLNFIVSEYCPGRTLRQHLDAHPEGLPVQEAVQIMICMAEALDHAHGRQILHRDLKPDNVLLDSSHATSVLPFTPRLTDFGIAKFVGEFQGETQSGQVLGTLRYMSPEQADGQPDRIGPASDIYSLGILLYETLAGKVPFQSRSSIEMLRQTILEDPPSLNRLRAGIPRDLEAICLKALEKSPERRYATAGDFAEDLRRFLAGDVTVARPLGQGERTLRWIRRHPAAASAIATVLAAVMILTAGGVSYVRGVNRFNTDLQSALDDARTARVQAVESEHKARQLLYAGDMQLAAQAWRRGDLQESAKILRRYAADSVGTGLRGIEWSLLQGIVEPASETVFASKSALYGVQFSPDGREAATWGADSHIRVFDSQDWRMRLEFDTRQIEVNELAYSPDGCVLATTGDDGSVKTWNAQSGAQLAGWNSHDGKAYGVQFLDEGQKLATCGTDGMVRIWMATSGEKLAEFRAHQGIVEAIAVSPDGRWLASGGRDGLTSIWELATLSPVQLLSTPHVCGDLVFTADSQQLITGCSLEADLCIWDVATGKLVRRWPIVGSIGGVAYRSLDDRIAAIDSDGCLYMVRRTDPPAAKDVLGASSSWIGHRTKGYGITFSPNREKILSVAKDGVLRAWNWRTRARRIDAKSCPDFSRLDFIAGRLWAGSNNGVCGVDARRGRMEGCNMLAAIEMPSYVIPTLDGKSVVVGSQSKDGQGKLILMDLATSTTRELLSMPLREGLRPLQFTPNGNVLYALARPSEEYDLLAVDAKTGNVLQTFPGGGSTDVIPLDDCGQHFLYSRRNEVLSAHRDTGEISRWGRTHEHHLRYLVRSPDGSRFAIASDRQLRLVDAHTGEWLYELGQHQGEVTGLLYADDGRRLISASRDGTVRVWDAVSGLFLLDLYRGEFPVTDLALSPDGATLAFGLERSGATNQIVVLDLVR